VQVKQKDSEVAQKCKWSYAPHKWSAAKPQWSVSKL